MTTAEGILELKRKISHCSIRHVSPNSEPTMEQPPVIVVSRGYYDDSRAFLRINIKRYHVRRLLLNYYLIFS